MLKVTRREWVALVAVEVFIAVVAVLQGGRTVGPEWGQRLGTELCEDTPPC